MLPIHQPLFHSFCREPKISIFVQNNFVQVWNSKNQYLNRNYLYDSFLHMLSLVNCTWNDWTIGQCSQTCGHGIQIDTREKQIEESNGGVCDGEATQESPCIIKDCPSICIFSN